MGRYLIDTQKGILSKQTIDTLSLFFGTVGLHADKNSEDRSTWIALKDVNLEITQTANTGRKKSGELSSSTLIKVQRDEPQGG